MSHSIEDQVLGAILIDNEISECAFSLVPECFENQENRSLFEDMLEIHKIGEEITPFTLKSKKSQDRAIEIIQEVVSTVGVIAHTSKLRQRYALNNARATFISMADKIHTESKTPSEVAYELENSLIELIDSTDHGGLKHISEIGKNVMSELNQVALGQKSYVKTGFTDLDENGWHLRNGTVIVVAGRPGAGKSAFGIDLAINSKVNVAFFSIEMNAEYIYERLLAAQTKIKSENFSNREIIKSNIPRILDAAGNINKNKIWLDDSPKKTVTEMLNQCKRMKNKNGLGLIIVDYMGLLKSGIKTFNRTEEVGEISHQLVRLAKTLNVPVVALSQLNRDCEKREDKRPTLSDLKQSGEIEQDAHMVIMLYRDEMYNEDSDDKGLAEAIVRKCRSGKLGTVKLEYISHETHFQDYRGYITSSQEY